MDGLINVVVSPGRILRRVQSAPADVRALGESRKEASCHAMGRVSDDQRYAVQDSEVTALI